MHKKFNQIKSIVGKFSKIAKKNCKCIEFLGGLKPFKLYEHYKIQMFKIYLADSDTKLILIGQKMSIFRVCLKKFCLNPK